MPQWSHSGESGRGYWGLDWDCLGLVYQGQGYPGLFQYALRTDT